MIWFAAAILVYLGIINLLTKRGFVWYLRNQWISENFQGERVVQGFGLHLVLHYFIYFGFILILFVSLPQQMSMLSPRQIHLGLEDMLILSVVLSVLSLIGWLDDYFGENQIKGLRGHFLTLFRQRKITSGMLKAVYGLIISIFCSYFYQESLIHWFISSSLVLFSIHFFNLLDVRPGRAIKSFWFLLVLIVPFLSLFSVLFFLLPVVLSTLVLFQYDRKKLAMLGDTGSNVLGGLYGFLLMVHAPVWVQGCCLILFVLLSFLAEKYSFTHVINKIPLLSRLDHWGIR